jgi:hypothetical protein
VSFGSKSQMETIQKLHFFSLFDFVMCEWLDGVMKCYLL